MPDKRKHRGRHPQDGRLFGPGSLPVLKAAVEDVSWLLGRGYNPDSALTLAGNRYCLNKRQRAAVGRASCSDGDLERRRRSETPVPPPGFELLVDGYNLLTTVEAALGAGVILLCRDGCMRDIASMRGTYRRVEETGAALEIIAAYIDRLIPARCLWYLDSPVSNSGRLKRFILDGISRGRIPWEVELTKDPDKILSAAPGVVVSADSWILNRCAAWHNAARAIIEERVAQADVVNLGGV